MSAVDGVWKVVVKSPMGSQESVLTLATVDGVLTGTAQSGQEQPSPINDAKVDGKNIFWVNHISKPMKAKVEFTGLVEGDTMNGKIKVGFMGSYPFTATRESK